ncbi:MAG: cell division topological specificity factor MinE [Clostridia bacterium]|nr:MAG: cell division topological specificity factor MinE [Clostridia bacterium]
MRWLRRGQGSKEIATERLRLVLVHDRAGVSPSFLEALKEDLLQVISRYMEVDSTAVEVSLTREKNSVALMASIPVLRLKTDLPQHVS